MLYYVKNPSGNVSDVTEQIYNRLKDNDDYKCWTEDPYENLPEQVTNNPPKSTEYTAREVKDMAGDMNQADLEAFISEDEDRVTVLRLLE